jgi:hypothetical protein
MKAKCNEQLVHVKWWKKEEKKKNKPDGEYGNGVQCEHIYWLSLEQTAFLGQQKAVDHVQKLLSVISPKHILKIQIKPG